jgi:LysR family transcriptional regulator, transcriptional activator of the cysJI operon
MEDRLYKFTKLVDAGSFTKAAAVMHISQPALTTAVKKLERELRAELLIRGNHTLQLTEAGRMAYQTAKEMAVQAKNLQTNIASLEGNKPELSLGLIDGLAELLFVRGEHLTKLEQSTQLSLTVDNSSRLITYVDHDALDLALISTPDSLPKSLTSIPLGSEPMILATATTRIKTVEKELRNGQLNDFLAYNKSSHTYHLVDNELRSKNVEAMYSFYSTSPEIILQLLLEGRGIAALPYLLVAPYISEGKLMPVRVGKSAKIGRPIAAIYRQGRSLPNEATEVVELTRKKLHEANLLSDQA